jgi:hypothetical protein
MSNTQLIEPLADWTDGSSPPHAYESALPPVDDAVLQLPPLLSIVPVAGPPLFAFALFGVALMLLLVAPLTLLVTVMLVPLIVAAALVAVVALVVAIVASPFVLVRRLRAHGAIHVSLPVARLRARRA